MKFKICNLLKARENRTLAFCFLVLLVSGCATYQGKVDKARTMLKADPVKAIEQLKPLANEESKDQLVYLFDYGTALQVAGDYKSSVDALVEADRMAEIKDYHSISKQATSVLLSEEMVQYKGDDFEKVIVNAMLAINFLSLGDLDGALVETRRLNEKLQHYRVDAKKNYEQNRFAVYLGALIWESNKDWDDAYIAFHQAYKLGLDTPYIREDLIRSAYNARRQDEAKDWEKKFGIKVTKESFDKKQGELVFIFQQGWGPRKFPSPQWRRIPKLFPVNTITQSAKLIVEDKFHEETQQIYSVEEVAIKTLDDQYAPLIAKRIASIAAKEIVSDQIRQKDETLGAIANLIMHVSDRADLRQWSTLPETFQIAKVRLKPGTYNVKVEGMRISGGATGENMETRQIKVIPGKKTFFTWRSFE